MQRTNFPNAIEVGFYTSDLKKVRHYICVLFCDASQSLHYRHLVHFVEHSFRAEREKRSAIFQRILAQFLSPLLVRFSKIVPEFGIV